MSSLILPSFSAPIIVRPCTPKQHGSNRTLRRRRVPQCAARKLLVVDLQELLRPHQASSESELQSFSERITVDRSSSKDPTYVMFSSVSGYQASLRSIDDAGLVVPDALATLSGTELYQRQYATPDPLWASSVCSGWTSSPVAWVLEQFFMEELECVDIGEDFVVKARCKGAAPGIDFCHRVDSKLKEMGITTRVILGDEARLVHIVPAAGSPAQVVSFCQMMLGIGESDTFVFGGDDLVNACVQGKGNQGLCGSGSQQQWEAFGGRVFVSSDVGVKALNEGLIHHAVL